MLGRIAFAAARTFFLALRLTLGVFWVTGVIITSFVFRVLRRTPEEGLQRLQTPVDSGQEIEGIVCPSCSAKNDETMPVCFRCGVELPQVHRLQPGLEARQLMGLGAIVFVIVLLIALAAL